MNALTSPIDTELKTPLTAPVSITGNGTGKMIVGDPGVLNHAGFSLTGTMGITSYTVIGSSTGDIFINSLTAHGIYFRENNLDQMVLVGGKLIIGGSTPTSPLQAVGLPTYINNAAALGAGLTAGAFYRDNGDPDKVCVVH